MLDRGDDLVPLERLAGREVRARLRGNGAVAQHVEVALELRGEVLLEQLPRSLGGALDGVAGVLVHPWRALLHDDLLAGADEPRALLADAVERGVELLLGLDAAGEVAAEAHRRRRARRR